MFLRKIDMNLVGQSRLRPMCKALHHLSQPRCVCNQQTHKPQPGAVKRERHLSIKTANSPSVTVNLPDLLCCTAALEWFWGIFGWRCCRDPASHTLHLPSWRPATHLFVIFSILTYRHFKETQIISWNVKMKPLCFVAQWLAVCMCVWVGVGLLNMWCPVISAVKSAPS